MKSLNTYFAEYAEFHKNPTNILLHYIGVPVIMFSLLGLLARVDLVSGFHGGWALWALATLWYLLLSWRIAILFTPFSFLMLYFGALTPNALLWGLFIGGWIVQLWGHKSFEKQSPAFIKNVEHLLIGPLWVFVKMFRIQGSIKENSSH